MLVFALCDLICLFQKSQLSPSFSQGHQKAHFIFNILALQFLLLYTVLLHFRTIKTHVIALADFFMILFIRTLKFMEIFQIS